MTKWLCRCALSRCVATTTSNRAPHSSRASATPISCAVSGSASPGANAW